MYKRQVSGYRVGADAYVAKPFSLEVLFSRIAVSYTHLDVYKRQPRGRALRISISGILLNATVGIGGFLRLLTIRFLSLIHI